MTDPRIKSIAIHYNEKSVPDPYVKFNCNGLNSTECQRVGYDKIDNQLVHA